MGSGRAGAGRWGRVGPGAALESAGGAAAAVGRGRAAGRAGRALDVHAGSGGGGGGWWWWLCRWRWRWRWRWWTGVRWVRCRRRRRGWTLASGASGAVWRVRSATWHVARPDVPARGGCARLVLAAACRMPHVTAQARSGPVRGARGGSALSSERRRRRGDAPRGRRGVFAPTSRHDTTRHDTNRRHRYLPHPPPTPRATACPPTSTSTSTAPARHLHPVVCAADLI